MTSSNYQLLLSSSFLDYNCHALIRTTQLNTTEGKKRVSRTFLNLSSLLPLEYQTSIYYRGKLYKHGALCDILACKFVGKAHWILHRRFFSWTLFFLDLNMDGKDTQEKKTPMTTDAAARIQSSEAKKNDGKVEKGSFPARAQRAAAKNEAKDWAVLVQFLLSRQLFYINLAS